MRRLEIHINKKIGSQFFTRRSPSLDKLKPCDIFHKLYFSKQTMICTNIQLLPIQGFVMLDSQEKVELYKRGFEIYINQMQQLPFSPAQETSHLEYAFEALHDWSLFHKIEDVEKWFLNKREMCSMDVESIPLNETKAWSVDSQTGNIQHDSGDFFVIHGLRVTNTSTREVGTKGWDQPILTQIGYDGGLLGIIRQRFSGIPHYLIEAKAEPGNYEKLQLSPSLQATFSNLRTAHKGRRPFLADFFENPSEFGLTVLYDAWLSEDGGRLFNKRNRGMLVEAPPEFIEELPDGFIWMSLFQIKKFLHKNAWINPHIRGILCHC